MFNSKNHSFFINPFFLIAGWKSLFWGLAILLLTSVLYYSGKVSLESFIILKVGHSYSLGYLVIESIFSWLILTSLLFIFARLLSEKNFRIIDLAGTLVFSRIPYIIVSIIGFFKTDLIFGNCLNLNISMICAETAPSIQHLFLASFAIIIVLLTLIWSTILMLNAFKVSCNLKGKKVVVSFFVSYLIAHLLTCLFTSYVLQKEL